MNHRLLTLLLVALLSLTAVLATGGAPAAAAPAPQHPEWEPNDSFDTANWIDSDTRQHGRIAPAGDVDYFTFHYWTTDTFFVDVRLPEGSPLVPVVALYDEWQNRLAQAECPRAGRCLTYTPTESGVFYAVVSDRSGRGGQAYEYSFIVQRDEAPPSDPYEPNDFLSEATPYSLGQQIAALMEPAGDMDTFVFTLAQPHDLLLRGDNIHNGQLLDAGGKVVEEFANPWSDMILTVPAAGTYYLQIFTSYNWDSPEYTMQLLAAPRSIYVSFAGSGRVGGVPFAPGDVLRYWTYDGSWHAFFRAADYGLRGNLVAFSRGTNSPDLFFAFASAQEVAGVGRVTPSDVLRYTPGYPDWGIEPGWERVLIGAHLGLTTSTERIDALAVTDDWSNDRTYSISTNGAARLPYQVGQLLVSNNDVLSFSGWIADGESRFFMQTVLSGRTAGFGKANVTGLAYQQGWHFAFDRTVRLAGVTFAPGDIAYCPGDVYYEPPCQTASKLFDASDAGVGRYKIDAIDVGPREIP